MLRLHQPISGKEYLNYSAVKKFLNEWQQFIQNGKVAIHRVGKSIALIPLLLVVVLPLFSLVLFVDEDETI
ncbi:hypothetical protein H6S82_24075 [Planktothrix sp. FACHB-1355]|uniref:Uncharacterized protein n=1 Tax=Aerosakkonema funiforme FACHB-1375 TaxID=2949571 RepID=A0A926ZMQ3_9CYAN|nr:MULTISPECIES: hypothetical protein [Oscillatoriales]MBD2186291.1 hypothetical protein [Aerosakkonema funiforme FACHB-1375]MBD3561898.1 hypothetical protein [Planktothrix sp. FACHB-1355]